MRQSDFNFVIASWLKTFKATGSGFKQMRDSEYFETYEPIVKDLIKRSDIFIACLREEQDAVVGFLAIERKEERDVLHYILVKDIWKRMGIGRYLLKAADPRPQTRFTHWTSPVQSLLNKFPQFIYNPMLKG